MVKTILVTGSEGQLGKSLRILATKKEQIRWVFCSGEELDITKAESIENAFKKYHPTHCINCAAFTNVRLAEAEPKLAEAINTHGVGKLISVCNQFKATLVHLSTDYVFDGQKTTPYTEEDLVNPLNAYGKTKAAGENLVLTQGRKAYVVRTSWLYAKEHGQNFYRSILDKASAGEVLEVVNDQTGTPTSTTALANYLYRLIQQGPPYGIYHFAESKIQTWYSFAKDILAAHKLMTELRPISSPKEKLIRPSYSPLVSIKPLENDL